VFDFRRLLGWLGRLRDFDFGLRSGGGGGGAAATGASEMMRASMSAVFARVLSVKACSAFPIFSRRFDLFTSSEPAWPRGDSAAWQRPTAAAAALLQMPVGGAVVPIAVVEPAAAVRVLQTVPL